MRKIIFVFALVCITALPVLAQENYKAEIFGGYQYTRSGGTNFNGWNGSVTGNLNEQLGITADISGAYHSENGASASLHNFLFGPTVSFKQTEKIKPFAHALIGISHAGAGFFGFGVSDNAFAMALGGGVDYATTNEKFAVRLIQADYLYTHFGGSQNNARISTGIVFRF